MSELNLAKIKAETLIESAAWLQNYHGKIVVVKFGGNAMVDDELKHAFAQDMAYLRWVGIKPIVVHGGGPQISAKLAELGIDSEFKGGYRVTDTASIDVVRDVLRNDISAELADLIEAAGAETAIMSGEDSHLIKGARTYLAGDSGEQIDIGWVGEVTSVNPRIVLDALEAGKIPVISTVAPDLDGNLLNINADLGAAALAVAFGAEKLMMLTDVPGLYSDWPNRDSLVSRITVSELQALLPTLETGMIPKMQACLNAVQAGVPQAVVIDGREPHSILLEVFTANGMGTQVVPDDQPAAPTQNTKA